MAFKPNEREYRAVAPFADLSQQDSERLIIRGTPIVFNTPTVLFEYDGVEYKEIIAAGALDSCDMSDFILNRNHGKNDGTVYARTRNKSLLYDITPQGLGIIANLDPEDERHKNLHRDIQKGRVDKMSFSFIASEESYNKDTHTRTILKFKKLFDVSAVDFPAYDGASITATRDKFIKDYKGFIKDLEQSERRRKLIIQTLL